MQQLSSAPNHVGSAHDRQNAEFLLGEFRRWGWEANIETFYVGYPQPGRPFLELIAPHSYTASLHEPD